MREIKYILPEEQEEPTPEQWQYLAWAYVGVLGVVLILIITKGIVFLFNYFSNI